MLMMVKLGKKKMKIISNKFLDVSFLYDKMSLPQRGAHGLNRLDKAEFQKMLPNINIIYLGASVVIFLDRSYFSRFWTGFEAWLSFRKATVDGLTDDDAKVEE